MLSGLGPAWDEAVLRSGGLPSPRKPSTFERPLHHAEHTPRIKVRFSWGRSLVVSGNAVAAMWPARCGIQLLIWASCEAPWLRVGSRGRDGRDKGLTSSGNLHAEMMTNITLKCISGI